MRIATIEGERAPASFMMGCERLSFLTRASRMLIDASSRTHWMVGPCGGLFAAWARRNKFPTVQFQWTPLEDVMARTNGSAESNAEVF